VLCSRRSRERGPSPLSGCRIPLIGVADALDPHSGASPSLAFGAGALSSAGHGRHPSPLFPPLTKAYFRKLAPTERAAASESDLPKIAKGTLPAGLNSTERSSLADRAASTNYPAGQGRMLSQQPAFN
jgi:hypothetical protein